MGQHVNTWAYDPASRCKAMGADTEHDIWLHCDRALHPMNQVHAMFIPGRMDPIHWKDGRMLPEPEDDE